LSITNGYATLAEIRDYLGVPTGDTANTANLERAVESASRKIEKYCGRIFYDTGSATAKTFRADDRYHQDVPDFHTITGLVVETDTGDDGTFDTTWASTDYQVEPLDPQPDWPWQWITAVDNETFPTIGRRARVQVTARWGWAAVPTDVETVCLELSGELFKRKEAPFGVAGGNDFGVVRVSASDMRLLSNLHDYQRIWRSAV
jgi:hypothetical protein